MDIHTYIYIRFNGTDRLILIPNYATIIGTRDQRRLVNRIDRARFRGNEIVSRLEKAESRFLDSGRVESVIARFGETRLSISLSLRRYFRMIRFESLSFDLIYIDTTIR